METSISELTELYDKQVAELRSHQVTTLFGRLVELFGKMKEQHPELIRLHMGMGTYSIEGKFKVQTLDYDTVKEDYPELKILKDNIEISGHKYVVYEEYAEHFEDYIDDVINGHDVSDEHCDNDNVVSEEAIEFIHICNYISDINYTTLFDGVNENGVIVSYGKGSHLDTYVDAKESKEVELLYKEGIPIVFHDTVKNEYFKYVHFPE